ncbi:Carboxylic ester hydrolase [Mycena sanguinolenta]|uniref:Carboxylic ester hydrolase n=1 Tax=Mycena sanguinolenta TaxID=230812 RepID=A0A8H6U499_9AGAR|nr:Carboxylic ester hydrolase [Mycena sanguinolenta]
MFAEVYEYGSSSNSSAKPSFATYKPVHFGHWDVIVWKMLTLFLYLSVLVRFGTAQLTSNLGPVVDLGYAAYAGNTTSPATGIDNGPVTFYGNIRYAQPPLGDLRFRAPAMLNESGVASEVIDARDWGPPCIQRPAVVGIGSEDCLTLNVWKPTNASAEDSLPVAVYIHGGGFYANTPQGFPMYDWVAQHPGGIVGVSITYRLNMLGFLASPVVAADGDLNTGLLDQRAGLEWVQRHISAFGGNPQNVTIYGESAGGASVVMQIAAYGGKAPNLFHSNERRLNPSDLVQPTLRTSRMHSLVRSPQFIGYFQHIVIHIPASAAGFIGCPASGDEAMPCFRKASLGAIVSAINRIPNGAFAPVIEDADGFLPDLPSRLIASNKYQNVEFTGGHCTGDGKTFAGGSPADFVTDDDIRRIVFARWPGVSNATIAQALTMYPEPGAAGSPFATQFDRAAAIAGDVIFTCMDWFVAEQLTSNGVENVFAFSWNAPDPVLFAQTPYRGAAHTSDLYFLFDGVYHTYHMLHIITFMPIVFTGTNTFGNAGNTFTAFNSTEAVLSKEAIAYWTSFAATGNPSIDKESISPVWESFVVPDGSRRHLMLNRGSNTATNSTMETITADKIQRCQFWMSENVTAQTRI